MVIKRYLSEAAGNLHPGGNEVARDPQLGTIGAAELIVIGFAFGFALLAGIWVVGHVWDAHFNPAVTLAFWADGRMSLADAIGYWVAQFAGGGVASLVVWMAAGSRAAVASTATTFQDLGTAITVEIVLTAVFVWIVMAAGLRGALHAPGAISLTLVGIHLAGIPFSGASVNPARSFGPAVVGADIGQLGVYIYAPLVGALLAWGLYRLFPVAEVEVVQT